ncbi:MAG: hypothetical protein ABSA52_09975, partial [Candidatus Binatia bacterium]
PCTDVFKRLLLLCSHLRSPFEDRTEFPEFFRSEFPEPAASRPDLDAPGFWIHRVEGVVDQVGQNLLQFRLGQPTVGEWLCEMGLDLHVAGSNLLVIAPDDFGNEIVDVNVSNIKASFLAETHKVLDDGFASGALVLDLRQGSPEFLKILALSKVLFFQQVLDPPRLFQHDRDGVVDLVCDPGREVAQQGQFPRRLTVSSAGVRGLVRVFQDAGVQAGPAVCRDSRCDRSCIVRKLGRA